MTRSPSTIIFLGPSGVGKSTVCKKLLEGKEFLLSVSATTRKPRGAELNGRDYHFLTREEFETQRDRGQFLECATVHGEYYGTPAALVLDSLAAGRHVFLDIDVQGASQLRSRGLPIVSILLEPPSLLQLRQRLEGRNDMPQEKIELRLERAEQEIQQAWRFDFRVVNEHLERTVAEIRTLLGVPG